MITNTFFIKNLNNFLRGVNCSVVSKYEMNETIGQLNFKEFSNDRRRQSRKES